MFDESTEYCHIIAILLHCFAYWLPVVSEQIYDQYMSKIA